MNRYFARGWLQGFFDGEGTVGLYTKRDHRGRGGFLTQYFLSATTTDEDLMNMCLRCFRLFGINCRVYRPRKKHRRYRRAWHICITAHRDVALFSRYINFANKKKRNNLKAVVAWTGRRRNRSLTRHVVKDLYVTRRLPLTKIRRVLGFTGGGYDNYFKELVVHYGFKLRHAAPHPRAH